MKNFFIKLSACLLGTIGAFFKAYYLICISVIFILFFDFITGLLKSKITGVKIESGKASKGFWKKIAKLSALIVGIFLDCFVPLMLKAGMGCKIPFPLPFGLVIGVYIVIIELISICENLDACGVPLPSYVINMLKGAEQQIENPANIGGDNNVKRN